MSGPQMPQELVDQIRAWFATIEVPDGMIGYSQTIDGWQFIVKPPVEVEKLAAYYKLMGHDQ